MIRNYIKIALRNLMKNKVFSFINIVGLALGLTCFMLIAMYVTDELSYDRFYPNALRIYRINLDMKFGGSELKLAVSSDPLGPTLKKDYPQVEQYTRIYSSDGPKQVKKGNQYIREDKIGYADSTLFEVFQIPVLSGNIKTALSEPNSVVMSKKAAIKYFNTVDAVGKTLEIGVTKKTAYKVTAVYQDIPDNSHFNFDLFLCMKNVDYNFGNFLSNNFYTYLLLREGTDYKQFEKNFDAVLTRYVLPQAKQYIQINSMEEFRKAGNKFEYSLIPLTDIHLKSDRFPEIQVNGSLQYVYIFSIVALFLLLIACINFVNLTTARSANRAKEVGIRKMLGTQRSSLIGQFIAESTLMSYLAFVFALVFTLLLIPYFNDIAAKSYTYATLFNPVYLPFLLLFPLVVGIIAGYYPAIFLSSFRPLETLKTKFNAGFKRSSLRNSLVTFQFVTSLVLIIGTIIIYQQLDYIQTKNLGFVKDKVLIVNNTNTLGTRAGAFKDEISQLTGITNASFAGYLPIDNSSRSDNSYYLDATMDAKNSLNMQTWQVDDSYLPTIGLELKEGRNFSKDFGTDSSKVIINETAVKLLGYTNPIGQKFYTVGDKPGGVKSYEVIGVIKNFHYESLRKTVGPLFLVLGDSKSETAFKINTGNVKGLIKQIETKWAQFAPEIPFSFKFMDDAFDDMYRAEQRVGKVMLIFAALTIIIACLGLFGLVTYIAEQRTKEIGVRKVLGASIFNIVSLLSRELLLLVLIALLIATPIAYYFMYQWLQDFAFRISISWQVFVAAGIGAMLLTFLTISFQAIKAAMANPVKSLRTE